MTITFDEIYFCLRGVHETFLRTPFYDVTSWKKDLNCKKGFQFDDYESPTEASNQTVDMNDLPVIDIYQEYIKIKVKLIR